MVKKTSNKIKDIVEGGSLLQLEAIVENSHDAIIGETLDGIIISWNGGARRMFGYSAEEVVGTPILSLVPEESKAEVVAVFGKIKAGGIITDYDSVRLRKDGSKIDVSFSSSPIKTENGTVVGVSCVERDITERKKSERHIRELSEVRSKFIEIISHQLRTPLTSINWNLEALLNGDFGKLEETQRNFLQATHSASVEITRRIHALLLAMDVEEGRVRYVTEEILLNSLCAGVVQENLEKSKLKNISVVYAPPAADLPMMYGDGEKIRLAAAVLVENAIGYTKEGGKIKISLQAKGNFVRFEVADTGVGIPRPEQHFIFTRFFRASNASVMRQDAFGIGLFIAKNFIEQHQGRIGFTSTEGKGSIFWFELPIKLTTTL